MKLEIRQRETEGIHILDLRGPLSIGPPEASLRQAILALAETGAVNVILNFADAAEIDEDGLAALVLCSAKLTAAGGALKLVNLSHTHADLIVETGLATGFAAFANEHDAVDSFFPDRDSRRFDILEFVQEQQAQAPPKPPQ